MHQWVRKINQNGWSKPRFQAKCGVILRGHAVGRWHQPEQVDCPRCLRQIPQPEDLGGRRPPRPPVSQIPQAPRPQGVVGEPTTRDGWVAWVKDQGLVHLGAGASRDVYALDDVRVIKINYRAPGMDRFGDQCENEYRVWAQATPEARQYLATIEGHGEGWTIMERAQFLLQAVDGRTQDRIAQDLRKITGLRDLHPGNIGYFGGGRFKILDYGL